jgi:uncharacterized membrane protein YjfL (UPF0719 family)
MEITTLLWIGETFFYILIFFILFVISKTIFKFRNRKIDIDNELTTKDNVAFSILVTGYFIGVLIIFLGVIQGESYGYIKDAFLVLSYGILGNVLLVISSYFNEKVVFAKKFNLYKEIIKDENNGTGFIEAANFIGSSLIIYGAINGKTFNLFPQFNKIGFYLSGFVSLLAFWFIGQLILFLFLSAYKKISNYNVLDQIEQDNVAVGIVYASILVSISYLYSQAIKGDIISWLLTLENIFYYMVLGLILLPISRFFVDKIVLPKSNLTDEIVNQKIPNQGAALIEAFAYLGSAILISYCI